jgi:signal transduction histidine kinase/DNA-binding response OmpR family regulator/ligand-binding sensor domain-containing protein
MFPSLLIIRLIYPAFALWLVFFDFFSAFSQTSKTHSDRENGSFFSRHYSPKEYGAFPQNWAALQNGHGVMVFANGDGILKYDGVAWEFHSLPNLSVVRSLAMDKNGRVYVGAYNELGYLTADKQGNHQYISLLSHLSPEQKVFDNVHKTYVLNGAVVFNTERSLLIWENEKFYEILWPERNDFKMAFLESGILYVHIKGVGLCVLQDREFKTVNGGEFFKDKKVRAVLPFNDRSKLILTSEHGLYLYNEDAIIPFKTEVDDFLKNSSPYCATALPDGTFAVGTLQNGLLFLDNKGIVKSFLNKAGGLGSDEVYNFCLDNQGALWATLSNGITRIEIQTPITHFMENSGLDGSVHAIIRYEKYLYVGTSQGLYKLLPAELPNKPAHFKKINELNFGVWGMAVADNSFFLNTDKGSFIFKDNKFRQLNNFPSSPILPSRFDRDIIYSGLSDGISILKKVGGQWTDAGKILGIDAETVELLETSKGDLWASTYSEGVFLVKFSQSGNGRDYLNPLVKNFGEDEGLPVGYTRVFNIEDKEVFWVKRNELPEQNYLFDEEKTKFTEYTDFAGYLGLRDALAYPISQEKNGRFWVKEVRSDFINRFIANRKADGQFDFQHIDFSRLKDYKFRVLLEENDIAWWGGHDGIVRLEISRFSEKAERPFKAYINKISLNNDSVLFVGTETPRQNLTFQFKYNSIRFEYAAGAYDAPQYNQYQYWLEGFDEDWSALTSETYKSYTRIPEGSYTFKVRGKNIYDDFSELASYTFNISPPWYRHYLAYALYALALVAFIFGVVKWRSAQLEKEKLALEEKVIERTAEVVDKNQQLEQLAEELETQATQLKELDKMKSNFFANISHEFRTPLTLLLSPLERALSTENEWKSDRNVTEMMFRNAKRLQTLINQLLDLSKLESGQMKLFLSKGNVVQFVKVILASFESLAQSKNIIFQYRIPKTAYSCFYDPDKLEIILNNLLSNAFKFTPEGGKVDLVLDVEQKNKEPYLKFTVSDTGKGIPETAISKIFDRFYQADASSSREFEGSGIGLSLTKELVILMNGNISVKSKEGMGSIFILEIPAITEPSPELIFPKEFNRSLILHDHEIEGSENFRDKKPLQTEKEDHDTLPLILLVEDNVDLSAYLTGILDKKFKIITAFNGKQGLEMALENIPDLILSDMMMPEMDGFELCTKIRGEETTSHIPFVLLTARTAIEDRLEGFELGADEYLTKPFNVNELHVRINNLLEQRRNLRERFGKEIKVQPKDITVTSVDERFLQKVIAKMEEKISDSSFSVETFSIEIGMSRKNFHRKLVALIDQTPNEFIRIFRLKRAAQLFEQKSGNVSEIAYQVGFQNLSYFAKCFKEQFGVMPNEFLNKKST